MTRSLSSAEGTDCIGPSCEELRGSGQRLCCGIGLLAILGFFHIFLVGRKTCSNACFGFLGLIGRIGRGEGILGLAFEIVFWVFPFVY